MSISISLQQIEEIVNELYLNNVLVVTEAGIRLTLPFLRSYMRNPQFALDKVVEIMGPNVIVDSNSSRDNSVARDIVECVCYLLVGNKKRKWVSLEELVSKMIERGYTITTTIGKC
ncbi:MAG: hypothetical protein QXS48_00620 [Candidatus Aenigmatarchaeota archaeon]